MPAEEKKFQPLKKGDVPSMMDTEVANEVIDHCHAIENLTIIPQGSGTLSVSGRTAVLDLTRTATATDGTLRLTLSKNGVPTLYDVAGTEVGPA